ncbi:MAG: hypothetical protein ACOYT8_01305 [Candidatus Dependentiae bacterium]
MKKIIVLTIAMITSVSYVRAEVEGKINNVIERLTPAVNARSLARDAAYIATKSCPNSGSVQTPLGTVESADVARYLVAVILHAQNIKGAVATVAQQALEDLGMFGFNTVNSSISQATQQIKLNCLSNFVRKVNALFAKDSFGNYVVRWLLRAKTQEFVNSSNVKSVNRK